MSRAQSVAENVWVILIARLAMMATPFVFAVLVYFATGWLDVQFDKQAEATDRAVARIDALEAASKDSTDQIDESTKTATETAADLNTRISVIETNNANGRKDREAFQVQTFNRLDKLNDSLIILSNSVAALNATVQAMQSARADIGRDPRASAIR